MSTPCSVLPVCAPPIVALLHWCMTRQVGKVCRATAMMQVGMSTHCVEESVLIHIVIIIISVIIIIIVIIVHTQGRAHGPHERYCLAWLCLLVRDHLLHTHTNSTNHPIWTFLNTHGSYTCVHLSTIPTHSGPCSFLSCLLVCHHWYTMAAVTQASSVTGYPLTGG